MGWWCAARRAAGHPETEDDPDPRVKEVIDALRALPPSEQDAVRSRLAVVALNFQRTRDIDPVVHFFECLLVTAQLHRNPAYRQSLAESESESESEAEAAAAQGEPTHSGSVADFMAAMRERKGA